jgi:hypothetical protein
MLTIIVRILLCLAFWFLCSRLDLYYYMCLFSDDKRSSRTVSFSQEIIGNQRSLTCFLT